ncbi:MAG: GAF domain-containing protein [Bacteroidales bacterium]|nr:GAF domain-containing protein [Bacteroidales bacterium]
MAKKQNIISFRVVLFLIVSFFMLLGGITFYILISNKTKQENKFIAMFNQLDRQRQINFVHENIFFNVELFRQYELTTNTDEQLFFSNKINQSFKRLELTLDSIRLVSKQEDEEIFVRQLYFNFQKVKEITLDAISSNSRLSDIRSEQYFLLLAKMKKNSNSISVFYKKNKLNSQENFNIGSGVQKFLIFIFVVGVIIGFFLLYLISRELRESVFNINKSFNDVLHNEIAEVSATSNIAELNTFNVRLVETNRFFLDIRDFVDNLVQDDFENEEFKDRTDFLFQKLEKLRYKLIENKKEISTQEAESLKRDWINSGLSKFNEVLRLYSGNLNELSSQLITSLVKYLKAIQGGIFIVSDEDEDHLELYASFAFNRKKYLQKTIKFGDGLVGTAVTEKRTIYLTELPPDYLEISSGLGETQPLALLIVPLLRDNVVYGVMELSSFSVFSKTEIEFVEKVAELTALTINTEKINHKTVKLLGESQRKSDELATQEEEMRQNLEELRATQEESKRKEKKLQLNIDSVDDKLPKIVLKPDRSVDSLNAKFIELTKFNMSLFFGKLIDEFLTPKSIQNFNEAWKRSLDKRDSEFRLNFISINKDFFGVLVPIIDFETGALIEMFFFLRDVSDFTVESAELGKIVKEKEFKITELVEETTVINRNVENQKVLFNQIFATWTKHLSAAELVNEAKQGLESKILKIEGDKKKISEKNEFLKHQLKDIVDKKSGNDDIDSEYKDWLDNL